MKTILAEGETRILHQSAPPGIRGMPRISRPTPAAMRARNRSILAMSLQGKRHKEIAVALGVSLGTVGNAIQKARRERRFVAQLIGRRAPEWAADPTSVKRARNAEIVALSAGGESNQALALRFGLMPATVGRIISRRGRQ